MHVPRPDPGPAEPPAAGPRRARPRPALLGAVEPLPAPSRLRAEHPIGGEAAAAVERGRRTVRAVLHGDDDRLLVVVGPCSIHDRDQALEYAERLARLAERTAGELAVVMRTYFEKPRTTVGWKGLINDPDLDGSFRIVRGLRLARQILAEIGGLGLACGSELLDPLAARYLEDGLGWASIGARTSASQIHREAASGWPMPVGLKNDVAGDIAIAAQAVETVRAPHHFVGVDAEGTPAVLHSPGNEDAHLILRGGRSGPNHGRASVDEALALLGRDAIARPVLVDCSHANSDKDPARQPAALDSVLAQRMAGQGRIAGVMLESFLEPGSQAWRPGAPLQRGVSITDGCLGWTQTEVLLERAAEAVAATR